MSDMIAQTTTPFVAAGGYPLPLLRTQYGSSITQAVTTTAGAATSVHNSTYNRAVRIWAIGCPINYICGGSGIAAPTGADGYVGADRMVEIYMGDGETHIRLVAASGTGTAKIELLR